MVPADDAPVTVWTSLRSEIVLKVIVLTVTVALLVSVVAFKILELKVFRQRIAASRQIVTTLHQEVAFPDGGSGASGDAPPPEKQRLTERLMRAGNLQSLYLVDSNGRVIAHPDHDRIGRQADDPVVRRALETGEPVSSFSDDRRRFPGFLTSLGMEETIKIATPLRSSSSGLMIGVAIVPLGDVKRSIAQSFKILIPFIALDAFIVVLFGSWFLSRALVRPLDRLAGAAGAVAAGDLSQKVPVEKRNEIGVLGLTFNLMIDRLRGSKARIDKQIEDLEKANADLARAQADLLRSEKLASVGRLAAGVAHEVGNPLSSILGLTDVLMRGGESGFSLPAEARDQAVQIRKETERIHRIIRRLLDFSRPSKPEMGPVDVNEVIRETVALATPMADLRPVEIRLELDPSIPRVRSDPSLLQQALMNLVVNAGQAMPDGGTLRIASRAARFEIPEAPAARRADDPPEAEYRRIREPGAPRAGDPVVEIAVSDSGEGIPKDLLPHIFDPFVTTKEPGRGTGLGLSVVHSIVEMLAGCIRATSDTGKGATFKLILPVTEA